jgi:hypothetical protein
MRRQRSYIFDGEVCGEELEEMGVTIVHTFIIARVFKLINASSRARI